MVRIAICCAVMAFSSTVGCRSAPPTPSVPPSSLTLTCESLDSLTLGSQIQVGAQPPNNSFQPPTMDIGVRSFTAGNGAVVSGGRAEIQNTGRAGGSQNEIAVNNVVIAISIGFGQTLTKVRFSFGEYGGNLDLSINNDFKNFGIFLKYTSPALEV